MGPRITPTLLYVPKKRKTKAVSSKTTPHNSVLEARLKENSQKAAEGWKAWEQRNKETQARERAKRSAAAKKAAATRKKTCGLAPREGFIIVTAHYRSKAQKKASQ